MRHTKHNKRRTKTLSIKVPSVVNAKVVRLAKAQRTTVSAIVRDALERYTPGTSELPSFAERAAKYIGVFSGPGDLSTNPKHLTGFGKWRR